MLHRVDGVEGAGHDKPGSQPLAFVGQPVLEQFRVRQDDPELVVQPMEQAAHLDGYLGGTVDLARR